MTDLINAMVLLLRCSQDPTMTFGARIEERPPSQWAVTWAFPMSQGRASREGYDRAVASGSFAVDDDYPGCPGCRARSLVLCGRCDKLGCSADGATHFSCPWCRSSGRIDGQITSLAGGGDL